jgi:CheY-like chemotaxis protein
MVQCRKSGPVGAFRKVLVVDDGARAPDHALSANLAELGYASITASLDAADEVLALVPSPAAILLQLPRPKTGADRQRFLALADRLRTTKGTADIPLILLEQPWATFPGNSHLPLETSFGAPVLNEPER